MFRIAIDEYKRGCYDSAAEFLYRKKYIADRLGFPFVIEYSEKTDGYFIKQESEIISGNELENYVINFLSDNNVR